MDVLRTVLAGRVEDEEMSLLKLLGRRSWVHFDNMCDSACVKRLMENEIQDTFILSEKFENLSIDFF